MRDVVERRGSDGLVLGPLRAADAEVLGPMHVRLWHETYRSLLSPAVMAAARGDEAGSTARWRERGLAHEREGRSSEGARTLVARVDDRPVGWCTTGPPRDDRPAAPLEMWSLYLDPDHQGSGVAAELFAAAAPVGSLYLWVLEGNERAIAFTARSACAPMALSRTTPGSVP